MRDARDRGKQAGWRARIWGCGRGRGVRVRSRAWHRAVVASAMVRGKQPSAAADMYPRSLNLCRAKMTFVHHRRFTTSSKRFFRPFLGARSHELVKVIDRASGKVGKVAKSSACQPDGCVVACRGGRWRTAQTAPHPPTGVVLLSVTQRSRSSSHLRAESADSAHGRKRWRRGIRSGWVGKKSTVRKSEVISAVGNLHGAPRPPYTLFHTLSTGRRPARKNRWTPQARRKFRYRYGAKMIFVRPGESGCATCTSHPGEIWCHPPTKSVQR